MHGGLNGNGLLGCHQSSQATQYSLLLLLLLLLRARNDMELIDTETESETESPAFTPYHPCHIYHSSESASLSSSGHSDRFTGRKRAITAPPPAPSHPHYSSSYYIRRRVIQHQHSANTSTGTGIAVVVVGGGGLPCLLDCDWTGRITTRRG
ncbi:hypothetical protein EX30DRAFT_351400 [Ascodesmis nigricans]|uniref:Uncharacterized protein n=1 Tax=Ascodesmis nigricans TaxID=341454 RepID=A0A4S2MR35_9PEZI|nr:hypothetical protein EX30DRAFT_351400 [Ascodesmis nigricans]